MCAQSSLASDEDEEVTVTEEQKLQKAMDSENIKSELIMKGDGVNFPVRSGEQERKRESH